MYIFFFIFMAFLNGKFKPFIYDALSGLRQFLVTESSLNILKKAFYFTLKTLFILKIFKFLVMLKNSLIRITRLISKLMTSQPGKQKVVVHILLSISRSKGNHTMKVGQLLSGTKQSRMYDYLFSAKLPLCTILISYCAIIFLDEISPLYVYFALYDNLF